VTGRGVLLGVMLALATAAPRAQPVVHGSADAYAAPGLAMAWAVARGADEASTAIVGRVAAEPATFTWLAVRGVDPFSNQQQAIARPQPIAGAIDVRIPRARFADTPRTEWVFYASEGAARAGSAGLVVYFLGVPDTAPEFTDAAKLDAYLAARLARARATMPGIP
jgi:hypothetical protein